MIGIIVITHGNFGEELLKAAESIVGKQENTKSINVLQNAKPEILQSYLKNALDDLSMCESILVFTDMLGGTPSNICLPFTKTHNIEIISGVNLYMLITSFLNRDKLSSKELVKKVIEAGQKNIVDVKEKIK